MLTIFIPMSERKFGIEADAADEEETIGEPDGEEMVSVMAEDFAEHQGAFPDFDRRLIQEILNAAESSYKYKPEAWSDLLDRLQAVMNDFKTPNPDIDEDDLRGELQGLLSEARDLVVH